MFAIQPQLKRGFVAVLSGCFVAQVASAQTFGSSRGKMHEDDAEGFAQVAEGVVAGGVAIQPDFKIVSVGTVVGSGDKNQVIVTRFHVDGALDTSFGDGRKGFTQFTVGKKCAGESIAIDPESGALIVVGGAFVEGQPSAFVSQLTPEGELDKSFQDNGVLVHQS